MIDRAEPSPGHIRRMAGGVRRRLWRALELAWQLCEGYRDAYRLGRRCDDLAAFERDLKAASWSLVSDHASYTSSVSSREMAASLELAALLRTVCDRVRPKRLVDLGSGFSSFVLRQYAARAPEGAIVFSVDDDRRWLGRTSDFLKSRGLPQDNLYTWEEFRALRGGDFDLVLHDLGSTPTRVATMAEATRLGGPAGIVVVDDIHKGGVRAELERVARNMGLLHYSLRRFTLDVSGRFAGAVLRSTRRPVAREANR